MSNDPPTVVYRMEKLEEAVDKLTEKQDIQHDEIILLHQLVNGMVESFRSLRNALYGAAATIVIAAVLVIVLGKSAG